jgi:hypothetical protein
MELVVPWKALLGLSQQTAANEPDVEQIADLLHSKEQDVWVRHAIAAAARGPPPICNHRADVPLQGTFSMSSDARIRSRTDP